MPVADEKPRGARGKEGKIVRPGWLVVAAACGWAALNQPPVLEWSRLFVWLLGTVTAGLLARAGLAVVEPLVKLIVLNLVRAARRPAASGRDGS